MYSVTCALTSSGALMFAGRRSKGPPARGLLNIPVTTAVRTRSIDEDWIPPKRMSHAL